MLQRAGVCTGDAVVGFQNVDNRDNGRENATASGSLHRGLWLICLELNIQAYFRLLDKQLDFKTWITDFYTRSENYVDNPNCLD